MSYNFISLIILIPLVWLLIVKIVSVFTTGIGYSDGYLVLSIANFMNSTLSLFLLKISMVVIRQSSAQKATDNCTLIVYTNAERTKYHIVRYLNYSETVDFLQQHSINFLK